MKHQQFQVVPDGTDSYIVIDGEGEARSAWRFAGVDHSLNALCECGGADDSRSATPPCCHLRAVEVFVFQHNASVLGQGVAATQAAECARLLEISYDIRVNEAKPEPAPKPEMAAPPAPERCSHYKLIQRFFAIAREAGLETGKPAKPRMRHAMESFVGRCVDSRGELDASEWQKLGDAIKTQQLAW